MTNLTMRLGLSLLAVVVASACGDDGEDKGPDDVGPPYYEGKAITIKVGFAAGGGYDKYARLHAEHLPRFIPGSPSILVENVTGGGSLTLTNQMFASEPKDGTVLGSVSSQLPIQRSACGATTPSLTMNFEPQQFGWVASVTRSRVVCAVANTVGIDSWEELLAADHVRFGGTGVGSTTTDPLLLFQGIAPDAFEITSGYAGTTQMKDAMKAGEIDGVCNTYESFISTWPEMVAGTDVNGTFMKIVPLFFTGPEEQRNTETWLQTASLHTEALSGSDLETFNLWVQSVVYDRPLFTPPGTNTEALGILRTAFSQMLVDPSYLADAATRSLTVDSPADGATVQAAIQDVWDMSTTSKDALHFLCQ